MPDVTITADILDPRPAPARTATSDMPVIEAESEVAAQPEPTPEPEVAETEAEAAAEAEQEAQEASEEGQEAKDEAPKRRNGISERFSDLTNAKKAAEATAQAERERREAAERALQEALARIPKPEEAKPEDPPPPPPRPKRDEFDDPDAYDEALVEWSTARAVEKARAEQEQHARSEKEAADRDAAEKGRQSAFETTLTAHRERVTAVAEKYPDYKEVAEADGVAISHPMAMAIMQSEIGPDAAYYLGKNPEVAEKIAGMVVPGQFFPAGHPFAGQAVPDVQRQLIEMGAVFAAVRAEQTPAPKPPPPPPAPINPLRSTTNRAVEKDPSEETMEEYAARRMPQLQAERRASGIFGTRSH